ncbi:methylmalonyl-CoA mutase family protein [Kaistia sp. UC242_56]|uniref:methylmalonyl-CoA mutase family protein n=1 Tax=Kaistia sp. UC242_56 TaxID=3374625 RepID=UPI0037BC1372
MSRPEASPGIRSAESAWRERAVKAIQGADFEAKLVSRTADDIRIEPLYPKAEGDHARPVRATLGAWRVVQRVDLPEAGAASLQALEDLNQGASGLALVFADAVSARGFGLAAADAATVAAALDGVMLDLVSLRLEAGRSGVEAARSVLALVRGQGLDLDSLSLDFGIDPFSVLARDGDDGIAAALDAAVELAGLFGPEAGSRLLRADGRVYHEACASEAQELALTLATGVAGLRGLEARGVALDRARGLISFLLAADAAEFLTIAKFRALRRLWARVEDACGLAPKPIQLDAETSFRMTTRHDPHVNMLRSTIAAFSAGLGGADSVTVLPFTAPLGLADAGARRLARNTQTILLEESGLGHVFDPAAGAGGFEALTDALCDKAWAIFQEIERQGGIVAALTSGWVAGEIRTVADKRDRDVRRRKLPITGTSEFPNLAEAPVTILAPTPPSAVLPHAPSRLVPRRTAEPFEQLRDRADALAEVTGRRPSVFLATLGKAASFSARAGFAKGGFEAAGIAAPMQDGFASLDELLAAARDSGAAAACLCASDEVYQAESGSGGETLAEAAARRLVEAGFEHVALAGRPGEHEAAYRHAGVEAFLYAGCDITDYPSKLLDGIEGQP